MPENNKSKHIVVMRLSAMGDVAMIVPVLHGLVQQYPHVKVTVVSRPFFEPFFKEIPRVTFYPVDLKKQHKGVFGMFRLYRELKKTTDLFADLHNVLRSNIVGFLFKISGISVATLDKARASKKQLTALKPKQIQPIKSMFEQHQAVFKKLGFPIDLDQIQLPSPTALSDTIKHIIGSSKPYLIGIAPFAQYETKVYPIEKKQQVIHLLEQLPIQIVLFGGGKKEADLLDKIQKNSKNCVSVAGKITLTEELQLIRNLDLMISMDSGNGHLAAMYGVPVLTLWGNTHPYAGFTPFRQPLSNSLTPDLKQFPLLPTSIYGNKQIKGYTDCIKTISTEDVVAKVKEILKY